MNASEQALDGFVGWARANKGSPVLPVEPADRVAEENETSSGNLAIRVLVSFTSSPILVIRLRMVVIAVRPGRVDNR